MVVVVVVVVVVVCVCVWCVGVPSSPTRSGTTVCRSAPTSEDEWCLVCAKHTLMTGSPYNTRDTMYSY